MSLSRNIREQLLKSFRAELAEHIQVMTEGLLKLEQGATDTAVMETTFRAAHSLKGASRAMGVIAIEQIAHALETILDGLRHRSLIPTADLFTAAYHALDAIQNVQISYEAGETTPPVQAIMVLAEMENARISQVNPTSSNTPEDTHAPASRFSSPITQNQDPATSTTSNQTPQYSTPTVQPENTGSGLPGETIPANGHASSQAVQAIPAVETTTTAMDETVRVDVNKLDALMADLSELMIARIRLQQREAQIRQMRDLLEQLQKSWPAVQGTVNRLSREQSEGIFSLHHPITIDQSPQSSKNGSTNRNGMSTGFLRKSDAIRGESVEDMQRLNAVGKDIGHLLHYMSSSNDQIHTLDLLANELNQQYAADMIHLSMGIDDLENEVKRLRMLPFNTITGTFARLIRDLAMETGKEASLKIQGGDTQIDKRILEGIKDPLTHLLRNTVDHGIESSEKRQANGKARSGQIILSARQLGMHVVISVSDDGGGLDMNAIRQAIENQNARSGVPTKKLLTDTDLTDAIFEMGITTSRIITDVSGRGVGLNVVKKNIEQLHGHVEVSSQPGKGTTFSITIPLALTATRCLMLKCAGQIFAIPLTTVERILKIQPSTIFTLEGRDVIQYDHHPVPVVRLSDVLELPDQHIESQSEQIYAVVVNAYERQRAQQVTFLVDDLAGEQEVVIKSLGNQLKRVVGLAGATVLGSGEVVLILNATELIQLAARTNPRTIKERLSDQASSNQMTTRKNVLIVDDSITTRTLEKNILEAAGYQVSLAKDGLEALDMINHSERPDLVVTDIVMPKMNGFELTRRIKEDPQTNDIPVILVTSLSSQADKEQGIEAQADAYIVKSSFDQTNLLDIIAQLI